MPMKITIPIGTLFFVALNLQGCATFDQGQHQVLVRDPKLQKYGEPRPAGETAAKQTTYAILSWNAYSKGRAYATEAEVTNPANAAKQANRSISPPGQDLTPVDEAVACSDSNNERPIKLPEWSRWTFPSDALQEKIIKKGLYLEVLEHATEPREIAVVFEGTNADQVFDWEANFRWLLRFLPGYEDQYTFVADQVVTEFDAYIKSRPDSYKFDTTREILIAANGAPIRIVTAGHSLGGGLAHSFAYMMKQEPHGNRGPKVSEVYAFDTSPVTAWSSAPNPPRNYNVEGLVINRIFEHGEALSYVRLLTSRFPNHQVHPTIWEYRYNFVPGMNVLHNHSMHSMVCGLLSTSRVVDVAQH